jgi:hypothetical protein
VRQATIAENCGTDVRTVKRAYRALRDGRWIELVARRGRQSGVDQYRLRFPDGTELGDTNGPSPVEGDGPRGHERSTKGTPTVTLGDTAEPASSENDDLKGIGKGIGEGGCGADATAAPAPADSFWNFNDDDPEPPRYCPRHPNGTEADCRACGRYGRKHDAWLDREPERHRKRTKAWKDAARYCSRCDPEDGRTPEGHRCDHNGGVITPEVWDAYIQGRTA